MILLQTSGFSFLDKLSSVIPCSALFVIAIQIMAWWWEILLDKMNYQWLHLPSQADARKNVCEKCWTLLRALRECSLSFLCDGANSSMNEWSKPSRKREPREKDLKHNFICVRSMSASDYSGLDVENSINMIENDLWKCGKNWLNSLVNRLIVGECSHWAVKNDYYYPHFKPQA